MWRSLTLLAISAICFSIVSSGNVDYAAEDKESNESATSESAGEHGAPPESSKEHTIVKEHTKKCAVNEIYVKCPIKRCRPQVCSDVGFSLCSSHEEKYYHRRERSINYEAGSDEPCPGPPACVCIDNYVRNDDGVCVHVTECASCGNDKNATFGCGVNCGQRCSNFDQESVECPDECYVNSCDCKKGYVFDDFTGKCVLPEDCSNKNPPEPEGADGTPGDGQQDSMNEDPCEDCDKKNCDNPDMKGHEGNGELTCNNLAEYGLTDVDSISCAGDPNAVRGCDETCENRCPGNMPVKCKCTEISCKCKDGFLFDPSTFSCVRPSECNSTESGDNTDSQMTSEAETLECMNKNEPKENETASMTTSESEMPTTVISGMESTTENLGSEATNTTESSGENQNTTKGSQKCKGKNEWYYNCAPRCPQQTCDDFLNGVQCKQEKDSSKKCVSECRCQPAFYKNSHGNCVPMWECRRPTTIAMNSSSSTATPGESHETDMDLTTTSRPNTSRRTLFPTWSTKGHNERSTTMMSTTPEPSCEVAALGSYLPAALTFTAKLLYEQVTRNHGNSTMISGSSILYLLAQLANYTVNDANQQIMKVLNLKDDEQVRCLYLKIIRDIQASYDKNNIDFKFFTKIYADNKCILNEAFQNDIEGVFLYRPENIDFSTIEKTTGVDTSNLSSLLLVNAQSIKGKWENPFNPKITKHKDFYTNGRIEKRPIMNQKGSFLYADNRHLGAKILKMQYVGGEYSLVCILPDTVFGLKDLLRKMSNGTAVLAAFNSLRMQQVDASLPKFNVSLTLTLKEAIQAKNLNVTKIFDDKHSGIVNVASCDNPYVSEVIQGLEYQVDESGMGVVDEDFTEKEETSPKPKYQRIYSFNANRPFVYCVFFRKLVLFAGVYLG